MIIDVSIENMKHLEEILSIDAIDGIILPGDRMDENEWKHVCGKIHEKEKKAYYAFPFVLREDMISYYDQYHSDMEAAGFDGYLIRSLDEAGYVNEVGLEGIRFFDQGMYTWNRRAVRRMKQMGADILTLPYEARREELELRGFADSEMVIYGRIPVMVSAQCTRKTTGHCRLTKGIRRDEAGKITEFKGLKDRKKAEFLEDSHCRFCYSIIYNSVPLWLIDQIPEQCERVRFAFTDEEIGEAASLLMHCTAGKNTQGNVMVRSKKPEGEFTRGHLKRGVE